MLRRLEREVIARSSAIADYLEAQRRGVISLLPSESLVTGPLLPARKTGRYGHGSPGFAWPCSRRQPRRPAAQRLAPETKQPVATALRVGLARNCSLPWRAIGLDQAVQQLQVFQPGSS